MNKVLDGTDLILSVGTKALAFSTGCKITKTAETGTRLTKEAAAGKWEEKYIKSLKVEITADAIVLRTADTGLPTYAELNAMYLAGQPVDVKVGIRGNGREADTTNYEGGQMVITSLDLDGQAGDDAKSSIKLESTGAWAVEGSGIKDISAS